MEFSKSHILEAPSNAKCMSKTMWNGLSCLCGEEIITGITSEVRDCSNTEKKIFFVRFAHKSYQTIEEFNQFLKCESATSPQELYLKFANVIRDRPWSLNW